MIADCPQDVYDHAVYQRGPASRVTDSIASLDGGEIFTYSGTCAIHHVRIGLTPTCTCWSGTSPCKHMATVFLDVLGVSLDDPRWCMSQLTEAQVQALLAPYRKQKARKRERESDEEEADSQNETDSKRRSRSKRKFYNRSDRVQEVQLLNTINLLDEANSHCHQDGESMDGDDESSTSTRGIPASTSWRRFRTKTYCYEPKPHKLLARLNEVNQTRSIMLNFMMDIRLGHNQHSQIECLSALSGLHPDLAQDLAQYGDYKDKTTRSFRAEVSRVERACHSLDHLLYPHGGGGLEDLLREVTGTIGSIMTQTREIGNLETHVSATLALVKIGISVMDTEGGVGDYLRAELQNFLFGPLKQLTGPLDLRYWLKVAEEVKYLGSRMDLYGMPEIEKMIQEQSDAFERDPYRGPIRNTILTTEDMPREEEHHKSVHEDEHEEELSSAGSEADETASEIYEEESGGHEESCNDEDDGFDIDGGDGEQPIGEGESWRKKGGYEEDDVVLEHYHEYGDQDTCKEDNVRQYMLQQMHLSYHHYGVKCRQHQDQYHQYEAHERRSEHQYEEEVINQYQSPIRDRPESEEEAEEEDADEDEVEVEVEDADEDEVEVEVEDEDEAEDEDEDAGGYHVDDDYSHAESADCQRMEPIARQSTFEMRAGYVTSEGLAKSDIRERLKHLELGHMNKLLDFALERHSLDARMCVELYRKSVYAPLDQHSIWLSLLHLAERYNDVEEAILKITNEVLKCPIPVNPETPSTVSSSATIIKPSTWWSRLFSLG